VQHAVRGADRWAQGNLGSLLFAMWLHNAAWQPCIACLHCIPSQSHALPPVPAVHLTRAVRFRCHHDLTPTYHLLTFPFHCCRPQSALAKERRELQQQQQRTLLEAIPKDLSRPWEDPMPEEGERHLAAVS
jgi:hypothetical protein